MARACAIYQTLRDFIEHQMRMSHIYQPVMLRDIALITRTVCMEDADE